jgi:hypothetical protein
MSTPTAIAQDPGNLTLALRHVALPALAPLSLVALYFTPLTVISCRDRGWLALGVVGVSTIAALICAAVAVRASVRSGGAARWVLSAAILALPAALLLGPLG